MQLVSVSATSVLVSVPAMPVLVSVPAMPVLVLVPARSASGWKSAYRVPIWRAMVQSRLLWDP